MSQRKINTFFDRSQHDSQQNSQYASYSSKRSISSKFDMPWTGPNNKYNPVLSKYHISRQKESESTKSFSMNKVSSMPCSESQLDSQGNNQCSNPASFFSSQDSYQFNGGVSGSFSSSQQSFKSSQVANSSVEMSDNQQIPLVKRELRQLSQVYQAECNKYQEKQMVNQLIEMTKCMEKGLSDYKTHNSQVQTVILEKVEEIKKLQKDSVQNQIAKSTACNEKLLQHFDDISENLIDSSKNSVKGELTDNFKNVNDRLNEIIEQVKVKPKHTSEMGTQYSPQVQTVKNDVLSDLTNSPFINMNKKKKMVSSSCLQRRYFFTRTYKEEEKKENSLEETIGDSKCTHNTLSSYNFKKGSKKTRSFASWHSQDCDQQVPMIQGDEECISDEYDSDLSLESEGAEMEDVFEWFD